MSVGIGMLLRALNDQVSVSALQDKGISRSDLRGDEIVVFDYIESHMMQFGSIPAAETVEAEVDVTFRSYPDEPLGYWIDRVVRRSRLEAVSQAAQRMLNFAGDAELDEAREELRELYVRLEHRTGGSVVGDFNRFSEDVWAAHDALQRKGTIDGIPFGIEYLDEVSYGAQPTDTIALVGRPGRGKSYFLFQWANVAHLYGKVPLVFTGEMSNFQCSRRILALRTGIPATLLRTGKVGFYGKRKGISDLRRLLEKHSQPLWLMQGTLSTRVEDLALRIQDLRPDVVYVDGAYLLRTKEFQQQRWERVTATAEFLKLMAAEFRIPIIATYQFNRRGPGDLGNIAFSDTIGQLASIVIGIDDEDDDEGPIQAIQYKTLELLKGREGERGIVRVTFDLDRMRITQESVISGYRRSFEDEQPEY